MAQQFVAATGLLSQQVAAVRSGTFPTTQEKLKAFGPPFNAFVDSLRESQWPPDAQQDVDNLAEKALALWAAYIQLDTRYMDPGPFIAAESRLAADLGVHAPCPFALPANAIGSDPRCTP